MAAARKSPPKSITKGRCKALTLNAPSPTTIVTITIRDVPEARTQR